MRFWFVLLLALVAGSVSAAPEQICLDKKKRFCAWEANPQGEQSVVLVHGLNGSALKDWHAQINELARDYHVLAIELPGFETEKDKAENFSMGYFAEVVRRFTNRYIDGPYYLVGHSMGGVISLRYALRYQDEIIRLVLADVPGVLHRIAYTREVVGNWVRGGKGEHAGFAGFVEKMTVKFISSGESVPGSDESLNEVLLDYTSDPVALASMQLVRQDFSGQLGGLNVPTLILWGEEDTIAPMRTAYTLRARLPNARLVVIPGAEHIPMREKPKAFNAALMTFLQADGAMPETGDEYAIPTPPAESERVGVCRDNSKRRFSGDYARIELSSCDKVVLHNVRAGSLKVHNSRVSIHHSHIGGGAQTAMELVGADVKVTASHIRGPRALQLGGSRVDIAGSVICTEQDGIKTQSSSDLLFSLSEMRSPAGDTLLHGFYALEPGETFSTRQ